MPIVVSTDLHVFAARRGVAAGESAMAQSVQRLSSGLRINTARDDAAGVAIAQRLTGQVRGADQAARNANDAISMVQTMDGAMQTAGDALQRLRELAVQSANGANSAGDRQALNQEAMQLVAELDRIARVTEFNGQRLLDGSLGAAVFQVGAQAHQTIVAHAANLRTNAYGSYQTAGLDGAGVGATLAGWGGNGVGSGTLTIQGGRGQASVTVLANQSADALAAAINGVSDATGVNGTARTAVRLSFSAAGAHNLTLRSANQVAVNVAFTMADLGADSHVQAAEAFNQSASKTGVSAYAGTTSGGQMGVFLVNETGQDILLSDTGRVAETAVSAVKYHELAATDIGAVQSLAADATVDSAVFSGVLTLYSHTAFAVDSSSTAYQPGRSTSTLRNLSSIDVSSATGAQSAIRVVDAALQTLQGERAKMGALQSRFETAIRHLQTGSENLTAARSRVEDVDYAAETAQLSRAQILHTAAVAIMAQANQLPFGVMRLLL